jgi:hypothetical protein
VDAGDFVLALARGTPRAFDGTAAVVFGGAAGQSSLTREQAAGKVVLLRLETLGAQRIAASSPLAAAAAVVYAGPTGSTPRCATRRRRWRWPRSPARPRCRHSSS